MTNNDKKTLNFIRRLLNDKAMNLNSFMLYLIDVLDDIDFEQFEVFWDNLSKARDLIMFSSNIIQKELEKKK